MNTDIRYLELVRGDLTDAARREKARRHGRVGARGFAQRLTQPIAVGAIATIVAAGAIGLVLTTGRSSQNDGGGGDGLLPAGPAATGETGAATGATGEGFENPAIDYDAGQATSPAPNDQGDTTVGGPSGEISRVIRTAQLGLEIPRGSFDERFGDAADVASDLGGYVLDSAARERSGSLTIRVPASSFNDAIGDLRDLGDVEVQRIEGQDVTAEYVDLQARIRIARSRRTVLLGLMNEARTIQQTVRVLNALDDTQLRIEQLQGQLNVLDDRTSLATISVELHEVGVHPPAEVEKASIPNAFERAVAGFVAVIAAVVIGLGYLTPLILIALIAWGVVILVRRRRSGA